MGNRFSDKGITVDESKVKAITQMPKVKNVLNDSLASFRMEVGLYHVSKLTALSGSIMKKIYVFLGGKCMFLHLQSVLLDLFLDLTF